MANQSASEPDDNADHVSADDSRKSEKLTGTGEGGTDMDADGAGEDEGGAPIEGDDSHLKDDQKPETR